MTEQPFAARFRGLVIEQSRRHVAGFVVDKRDEHRTIDVEIGLLGPSGFDILVRQPATQYSFNRFASLEDHRTYFRGFYFTLAEPLGEEDPRQLAVRVADSGTFVPVTGNVRSEFKPIKLVAMDITNNCNLRCPFCSTDYRDIKRTFNMEQGVYERIAELAPLVGYKGNFWLSCGNEPTLHPQLLDFIELIPSAYRDRIGFTTNLARPLRDPYMERLVNSGIYRMNVSIDSMSEPAFSHLRRGGKLRIFRENLERLSRHLKQADQPPRIEVVTMGFKSNFDEIPDMVRWTRDHLDVDDHSVRYAWRGPHMDQAFMDQEQLDHDDWDRLQEIMDKEGLSCTLHPLPRDHDSVPFDLMSPTVPLEEQTQPPLPLSLQVRWNGAIEVNGFPYPGEPPRTHIFKTIKVSDSNQPLIDRLLEV